MTASDMRGAEAMSWTSSRRKSGWVRSSENSGTPAGNRDRKSSKRSRASSALPASPKVVSKAGSNSVRWARAAAARVAA
ncbi:hypothetical protein D9M68_987910 [compost metagenome]